MVRTRLFVFLFITAAGGDLSRPSFMSNPTTRTAAEGTEQVIGSVGAENPRTGQCWCSRPAADHCTHDGSVHYCSFEALHLESLDTHSSWIDVSGCLVPSTDTWHCLHSLSGTTIEGNTRAKPARPPRSRSRQAMELESFHPFCAPRDINQPSAIIQFATAALIHCVSLAQPSHFPSPSPLLAVGSFHVQQRAELIRPTEMASINDLATAASALVTPAAAPLPSLPDSAAQTGDDGHEPAVARGALVVLEGLDRSGKTTQVKLLEQRFVELGRKVKVMRFPGMYIQHESRRNEMVVARVSLWNERVSLTDGIWVKRPYNANWPDDRLVSQESSRHGGPCYPLALQREPVGGSVRSHPFSCFHSEIPLC